jgi:hypothetical protein
MDAMHADPAGQPTGGSAALPLADRMLAEMAARGQARNEVGPARPANPQGFRPSIARVRYTHEAMIELIITRPEIHQNELAEIFGFSPAWISVVINSDAFQAKLALMKEELINPEIRLQLNERFRALTTRSLQVLQEKLSQPLESIPDNLALRAAELGAKALGLGGNASPQTVVISSEDRLRSLASRLTGLMAAPPAIDVEAREVPR